MITTRTAICCTLALIGTSIAHAHTVSPDWIERLTGERIVSRTHSIKPPPAEGDPRDFERTFFTIPEWYIVYSAQEYGIFVTGKARPSSYPYFASVEQYKQVEDAAVTAAGGWDEVDATTRTVLTTIRLSYAFETRVIGFYEQTIGRAFEALNGGIETREDEYIASVAASYGTFLNHTPWFAFPYGGALHGLWSDFSLSSFTLRGIERRVIFTLGYTMKYLYAAAIKHASESAYGGAGLSTTIMTDASYGHALRIVPRITIQTDGDTLLIHAPRYRALRDILFEFAVRDVPIQSIQNHTRILVTYLHTLDAAHCLQTLIVDTKYGAHFQFAHPLLIGTMEKYASFRTQISPQSDAAYARASIGARTIRSAVLVDTLSLSRFMKSAHENCHLYPEHIYDY